MLAAVPGGAERTAERRAARALLEGEAPGASTDGPSALILARLRLHDEVAGLVVDLARAGSWVATLDGAADLDADAAALLAHVARRLGAADGGGLLVVAGEAPPEEPGVEALEVGPLDRPATAALLAAAGADLDPEAAAAVHVRAEGLPLGVLALGRALAAGERPDDLPATLTAGLGEGLPLAQALALAGGLLPLGAVEELVRRGAVPGAALRRLLGADAARLVDPGGGLELRLAARSVGRAARVALEPAARDALAASVEAALEAGGGRDDDALVRARRARAAGDRAAAARHALVAGRLAVAAGAAERAVAAYRLALPLLEPGGEDRLAASRGLAVALRLSGRGEAAREALDDALAAGGGPEALVAELEAELAGLHVQAGRIDDALAVAERGLARGERPVLRAARGRALLRSGRYAEARADLERALADLGGDAAPATPLRVLIACNLAVAWKEDGDYPRAVAENGRALALARAIGDLIAETNVRANLGSIHLDRQDYAEALDELEAGLALARRVGYPPAEAIVLNNLGAVRQGQSRLAEAAARYEECLALARAHGLPYAEALATGNLGNVALRRGRPADAAARFRESLAVRERTGDRRGVVFARWHLGQVEVRRRRYQAALEPLVAALLDAEDSARELVPDVLLSAARARLGLGDAPGALRLLERAERRAEAAERSGILGAIRALRGRVRVVAGEPEAGAAEIEAAFAAAGAEDDSDDHAVRAALTLAALEPDGRRRRPHLRRAEAGLAALAGAEGPAGEEATLLEALRGPERPDPAAVAAMPPRAADDQALDGRAGYGWGVVRGLAHAPPERVLERVLAEVAGFSGASGGAVVLLRPDGERAVVAAIGDLDAEHLSHTLIDRALEAARPVLVDDAGSVAALQGARSVQDLGVRAALAVPIRGAVGPAGVLLVVDPRPGQLGPADLELADVLCGLAAAALRNARLAEELQRATDAVARLRPFAGRPAAEAGAPDQAALVGTSAPIRRLRSEVARLAASDLPVLVTGETGAGKEVVARLLHGRERPGGRPLRGRGLRRPGRGPAGGGAVRGRGRGLHRRHDVAPRPVRGRPGRHAPPRARSTSADDELSKLTRTSSSKVWRTSSGRLRTWSIRSRVGALMPPG